MSKKLYIGNLSFSTTEERLESLFSEYGTVLSVNIIMDQATNKSKGFGFVELEPESAAQKAIDALHGREVDGRKIRVSEAQERPSRPVRRKNDLY